VGGVFAAPFLKIAVDARLKLKAAGLFESAPAGNTGAAPPGGAGAGLPGSSGPPGASPDDAPSAAGA